MRLPCEGGFLILSRHERACRADFFRGCGGGDSSAGGLSLGVECARGGFDLLDGNSCDRLLAGCEDAARGGVSGAGVRGLCARGDGLHDGFLPRPLWRILRGAWVLPTDAYGAGLGRWGGACDGAVALCSRAVPFLTVPRNGSSAGMGGDASGELVVGGRYLCAARAGGLAGLCGNGRLAAGRPSRADV